MVTNTQIPKGYKQTDAGVIPEDWEVRPLGDLADYRNGKSFESNIVDDGKYYLITLNSLDINGKLKGDHLKVDINDRSLQKGDLIMILSDVAHGNFLGLTDLIPDDNKYVLNQRVGALKNTRCVSAYYLSKYINLNQKYFKLVGQGSSQLNLSKDDILNFSIAYPNTDDEQNRITSSISNIDSLISKLNDLIEKKRNVKQGAMQELLTGKRRLPGFSGTWEEIRLGDVCGKITTGKLDANAMVSNGEYPFFTCAAGNYWIDNYAFDDEALLVSGNGANVGYIHYYKGKFNAYQRTYVLTNFNKNIHFVKLFMDRNLQERIRIEVNAGNTPYIKMDTLADMKIMIPKDNQEQEAIAQMLNEMDDEIILLEKQRDKYLDLKQGMMQQLLTGKIRFI